MLSGCLGSEGAQDQRRDPGPETFETPRADAVFVSEGGVDAQVEEGDDAGADAGHAGAEGGTPEDDDHGEEKKEEEGAGGSVPEIFPLMGEKKAGDGRPKRRCPGGQMEFEGRCEAKEKVAQIVEEREKAALENVKKAKEAGDVAEAQNDLLEQQVAQMEKAEDDLDEIIELLEEEQERIELAENPHEPEQKGDQG